MNESLVDKRIDQVVEWASASDTCVKYTSMAAAQVVGTYSGITEQIAKQTKRSVSTVQNWAHAKWMYDASRKVRMSYARKLWRELPLSFWWIAWTFQQNGYEATDYLVCAYENEWSTRDMREEFKRDVEAGTARLQTKRVRVVLVGLAHEVLNSREFTEDERMAAGILIEAFERS